MVKERGRVLPDVPVGDAVLGALGTPLTGEAVAEMAAVRTVFVLAGKAGASAGVEVQKMRHGDSPVIEFICRSR